MLLPTKGISADRALLTVGSKIISLLDSPATVSGLWERFRAQTTKSGTKTTVTFDWFALAVTMLFAIHAVRWGPGGQLERCHVSS